jgi:hypothetical protein
MEQNKTPTATSILNQYDIDYDSESNREYFENQIKTAMIEFAKLHLKNQAEFIAEKAFGIYEKNGFTNTGYNVKQSILSAGDEYINKEVK